MLLEIPLTETAQSNTLIHACHTVMSFLGYDFPVYKIKKTYRPKSR